MPDLSCRALWSKSSRSGYLRVLSQSARLRRLLIGGAETVPTGVAIAVTGYVQRSPVYITSSQASELDSVKGNA